MPVLKSMADLPPEPETEMVKVRITPRGNGKISTGVHHARGGEECYATGEEATLEKATAEKYADENDDYRWVTILGPVRKTMTLEKA